MNNSLSTKTIASLVVVALVSGLIGGMAGNRLLSPAAVQNGDIIVQPVEVQLVDEKSAVIETIEKVSPSVVSIVITQELSQMRSQGTGPFNMFFQGDPFFEQFFGQPMQPAPEPTPEDEDQEPIMQKIGGGSGFFINEEGLILTNRHVVSRDDVEYTVMLHDDSEYKAEVVSRDVFNDIAVIRLVPEEGEEMPDIQPVRLGTSDDLKIGQSVIAIGNALAEFENSATTGIISAKGRQIVASDGMGRGENLSGLIQTDAAINPGNSGGPLINLVGEVVGVNTAIAQGANGIGFAIPIDDVKPVLDSIQEFGRIVRPILGVMYTMLTPELSKELEIDVEEGALLKGDGQNFAVLPGKPAEKAGLQEKDVIIEVDGNAINEDFSLQEAIMDKAPGDTVSVKYLRQGQEREVTITLEEAESDNPSTDE